MLSTKRYEYDYNILPSSKYKKELSTLKINKTNSDTYPQIVLYMQICTACYEITVVEENIENQFWTLSSDSVS